MAHLFALAPGFGDFPEQRAIALVGEGKLLGCQRLKERSMHRAKLLDSRPIPITTGDIPVATDVFLHNLEPFTLETLRRTMEQGLTPSGLDFAGDDDSIVVLRFTPADPS
jgi:hypothetical protein